MNVESVWLQRNGKRAKERPQMWNAQKERRERAKGTAKVDRNAAKMKTAAKAAKGQTRATAQCCMIKSTHAHKKEHAPIYRLHTKTMYAHTNTLYTQ